MTSFKQPVYKTGLAEQSKVSLQVRLRDDIRTYQAWNREHQLFGDFNTGRGPTEGVTLKSIADLRSKILSELDQYTIFCVNKFLNSTLCSPMRTELTCASASSKSRQVDQKLPSAEDVKKDIVSLLDKGIEPERQDVIVNGKVITLNKKKTKDSLSTFGWEFKLILLCESAINDYIKTHTTTYTSEQADQVDVVTLWLELQTKTGTLNIPPLV